jgi:hypothetical protein
MNGIEIKQAILRLLRKSKLPIPASIHNWDYDQLDAYHKLVVYYERGIRANRKRIA